MINFGIDNTPISDCSNAEGYFLYYSTCLLTDHFYIKDVYSNSNLCWVMFDKNIPEGKYLTTSEIKGIAIYTDSPVTAFGEVITSFKVVGNCRLVQWRKV